MDRPDDTNDKTLPKILYVDDEEHNLTVFEATFEDYYEVRTAESARQAFRILQNEAIQVLVADQRMPEMTGVQLLEAVIDEYPEVIRLILTGYADMDAVVKAINSGRVYHYATKPWKEQELKIILDRAFQRISIAAAAACEHTNAVAPLHDRGRCARGAPHVVAEMKIEEVVSTVKSSRVASHSHVKVHTYSYIRI